MVTVLRPIFMLISIHSLNSSLDVYVKIWTMPVQKRIKTSYLHRHGSAISTSVCVRVHQPCTNLLTFGTLAKSDGVSITKVSMTIVNTYSIQI